MIIASGKHYLYRYITLDSKTIFYIGIGTKCLYGTFKREYARAYAIHKKNSFLNRIIKKHGYKIEILLESDDYKFLIQKEIEFIKLYGRRDLGAGTLSNLTNGGEGVVGAIRNKEWRNKIGLSNKGKTNSNKGKHWSEEVKQRIRNSNLGVKRSEYTKDKIKIARQKQDMSHTYVPVVQLTMNGEYIQDFKSAKFATIYLGHKSPGNIGMVCRGRRPEVAGFKWMYKKDYEEMIKNKKHESGEPRNRSRLLSNNEG